ncbi:hypothetical protein EV659_1127 [Rhodothalassium salexigens DSM 2132]|uniref:Uncharacterized protein n=1 Tax=Rhodothalassium salexigens DSM 2132 TaxID=1188247 RepID=A0A4R2P9Q7_RHOSA|nr:hypothetical protein [Rhodothalassium salexigens]MBB4212533.1 hypothetical protein [Rhodothalassium salexigens DSM 2132]MBK1639666.1 hypothetical protein [Rhodothalassium salexigens DSM 2132]TCP31078.1 hypothetical protein EV659_1127 [Rhodothalassium salexigens DSM 2132]
MTPADRPPEDRPSPASDGRDDDPIRAGMRAARNRRQAGNPWLGIVVAAVVFVLIWAGLRALDG